MYQHVLAVIDLSDSSSEVIVRAYDIARLNRAVLTVLHVCHQLVSGYSALAAPNFVNTEMEVKQDLFPKLKRFVDCTDAGSYELVELKILFGRAADVIHEYVDAHQCDLVVSGSHGHTGVRAILGSTVNAILHGASCDVYCVRIGK